MYAYYIVIACCLLLLVVDCIMDSLTLLVKLSLYPVDCNTTVANSSNET